MNNRLNSHLSPFVFKHLSRRNIHANCTYPCYCKMGRYGLDKKNGGRDEIDYASKSSRILDQPNRSYGPNEDYYEEDPMMRRRQSEGFDEVDNIASIRLSSSLPATLRFRPHYSYNEDQTFSSNNSINQSHLLSSEESQNSLDPEILENSPRNRITSSKRRSRSRQRSVIAENTVKNENKEKTSCCVVIGTVVSLCVCLIYFTSYNKTSSKLIYNEQNFINDLYQLSQTYPIEDDELLKLQSGITTISQREDAGSFIFVYDSSSPKYNNQLFNKFVENVARLSVRFLRNDTSEENPVIPTSSDLSLPEHAALVSLHRAGVTQSGVMLVHAVSRVPARLAGAFHYYCDEYNPLVKKSAVFFTLDAADCPRDQDELTQHSFVEKCLSRAWKALPIDYLGPLLTRVVNVVIDMQH